MIPAGGAPMQRAAGGPHGPIGKTRNAVMTFVLSMVCFVYAFIALWGTVNELKNFRQRDDINPIFFFIPILNLIEMWKIADKVLEAKQMAGVPNAQVQHPVLYLLLWPYFLTEDLNEIWQAAGGGRPPG
jgi:hypothetical protein